MAMHGGPLGTALALALGTVLGEGCSDVIGLHGSFVGSLHSSLLQRYKNEVFPDVSPRRRRASGSKACPNTRCPVRLV